MYDRQWGNALNPATGGAPTWVSVTSFNEWHEGSMIEPARSNPPGGHGYLTYQGAYGTSGAASETAYLDRTRYWVGQFTGGSGPQPNPDLAIGRPISASSNVPGYFPGYANDGNQGSYWESANNAFPQSITLDLGVTAQVSKLVLKLPASWGQRTQTLSVLGADADFAFHQVAGSSGYTFTPSAQNTVTVTFTPVTHRYFRLAFTANTGWPAGQLAEWQAFRI
jgi:hypothetical protein